MEVSRAGQGDGQVVGGVGSKPEGDEGSQHVAQPVDGQILEILARVGERGEAAADACRQVRGTMDASCANQGMAILGGQRKSYEADEGTGCEGQWALEA